MDPKCRNAGLLLWVSALVLAIRAPYSALKLISRVVMMTLMMGMVGVKIGVAEVGWWECGGSEWWSWGW